MLSISINIVDRLSKNGVITRKIAGVRDNTFFYFLHRTDYRRISFMTNFHNDFTMILALYSHYLVFVFILLSMIFNFPWCYFLAIPYIPSMLSTSGFINHFQNNRSWLPPLSNEITFKELGWKNNRAVSIYNVENGLRRKAVSKIFNPLHDAWGQENGENVSICFSVMVNFQPEIVLVSSSLLFLKRSCRKQYVGGKVRSKVVFPLVLLVMPVMVKLPPPSFSWLLITLSFLLISSKCL